MWEVELVIRVPPAAKFGLAEVGVVGLAAVAGVRGVEGEGKVIGEGPVELSAELREHGGVAVAG